MADDVRTTLARSRRALQNPYAHIEELESLAEIDNASVQRLATDAAIHASRKVLQDPYAYVDDDGYAATDDGAFGEANGGTTRPRRVATPQQSHRIAQAEKSSKRDIADAVRQLHGLIWKNRHEIGEEIGTTDPLRFLDPEIALHFLGLKTDFVPELGSYRSGSQLIEVAGLIDWRSKRVKASLKASPHARRFTLAHELGHAVLHPEINGLHRDRASDGSSMSRAGPERDADVFATLFLMPEKLVRAQFRSLFQIDRFAFTEEAVVALGGERVVGPLADLGLRAASRLLAGAVRYNGRDLTSLAELFQVSRETMAIRLEELDLIDLGK